ncbi:MAG TPA: alanine racemase [Gammaproteobacteria bacterium]|nr:alanine racemase [Gammaproteobacteria bacterium]
MRPARVVIDLDAARSNLRRVRVLAPKSKVMAVMKADAYGHGLTRMARACSAADAFGVACLEEAVQLREAGIHHRIVLLEGVFDAAELAGVRTHKLDIVVHSPAQLEMLERAAPGAPIPVWLKIDTGMHRLGLPLEQVPGAWQRLQTCKAVAQPVVLMTHLASAQDRGASSVMRQLRNFESATAAMSGERCIANSAAVLSLPAAHADWVRPGLMLYGVSPFEDGAAAGVELKPVMTLRSALIAVNHVRAGETIGYGGTWTCPEDMPVGVVAMGYGDGYPRHAESGTPILVNGKRASLIGRPSMDMLSVDLRNVPGAKIGDPVVLWGLGDGGALPVEEVARHADTIPYQLLCSVKMRARFEVEGAADDARAVGTLAVEELDLEATPVDDGIA